MKRMGTCKRCGAYVSVGKTTGQPYPAHHGSKACRAGDARRREAKKSFPVTDPDHDAPDGATIDGFTRSAFRVLEGGVVRREKTSGDGITIDLHMLSSASPDDAMLELASILADLARSVRR